MSGIPAPSPARSQTRRRARLILAEDHPAMAVELHRLLATDHDVVDIVDSGLTLIDVARRIRPDLIVSDIALPGLNGLEAAAAILAAQPDSRIVFVTVQDDRAVITRAIDRGGLGYVLKCDAGDELVIAVRTVLDGGRYLSVNARLALRNVDPFESR